jgi:hypothetical protein
MKRNWFILWAKCAYVCLQFADWYAAGTVTIFYVFGYRLLCAVNDSDPDTAPPSEFNLWAITASDPGRDVM